jgi:iron complex outermembrane receptor protein
MKTILSALIIFICTTLYAQVKDTTYKTETIEVDALKGIINQTPVAFQNIPRSEVKNKYWMQDLPMFLNGNTSINSYSESGGSIGYSYLSIRGFDQRRISILINGTPQNDPEDHQVYWVDLSDLTASVENIQIQRGIGTALYGSSAIGGVINIQTIDFTKQKFLNVNAGYGDFNSKRYSLEYSTGLLKYGIAAYGKFTKTRSDGYRDQSFSDHWSYFLSAAKVFKNSVLKLNLYGGPIKNHLAYYGVTKDYLDGKITGDVRRDRKFNPLTYSDETDNYNQPHYELIYNWQPSKNLFISNTLNYIRGEGYFNTSFPTYFGLGFDYFRLQPFFTMDSSVYNPSYYRRNPDGSLYFEAGRGYQVERSNIVTQLFVNNDTYGWFPKLQFTHSREKGRLVIGGEIKIHNSEHYGNITYADVLPPGTPPNYQYYFYNGKKRTYSAYINEVYIFNKKLLAMLGLQYVYHKYSLLNDTYQPYAFEVNYNFFTPRFGMNYIINDKMRLFANLSIAKREPRLKDIYDAENPYAVPNFRILDPAANIYEDPLVKPETMNDYELGYSFTSKKFNADFNFYYMNFRNEIVSNGQLDNVGQPINGNAGRSFHIGAELGLSFSPFSRGVLKPFNISGNLNISRNKFTEYTEILGRDSLNNIIYGNDFSGNSILLNPEVIANLSLNYFSPNGIGFYISAQHIGKQYLDNSENERKNPALRTAPGYTDKIINPYTIFNAGLSIDMIPLFKLKRSIFFSTLKLNLKVNNIFDKLYEASGNVDYTGTPSWIPAATRNYFLTIESGF